MNYKLLHDMNDLDRSAPNRIRQLARDLPAVWAAQTTTPADRKAMLRLVMEAVAIHPVDVPTRATSIRVQWTSGAVSNLTIARPSKGESRVHAPDTIERIRQLAAAGLHDDEIARQLNTERRVTGAGLAWKEDLVRRARRHQCIDLVVADRPRMHPLPLQHPDGRYSVPGAAARFGVSPDIVRRWIKRGLVTGSRADFGTHRGVYWLQIDDVTEMRLKESGYNSKERSKAK